MSEKRERGKIIYFVNNAAFFVSHRLIIAQKAISQGYEVMLLTGLPGDKDMETYAISKIKKAGINHTILNFTGSGINLIKEIFIIFKIYQFLKINKPDLLHLVSPKAILYGGIVSNFLKIKGLIYSISGMGFVFTKNPKHNFFRKCLKLFISKAILFSFRFKNKQVIIQNQDDYEQVIKMKLANPNEVTFTYGSGVELNSFEEIKIEDKKNIVLFAGRVLEDKGVRDFVKASELVKEKYPNWKFIIIGSTKYDNPSAIPEQEISRWRKEKIVEVKGHVDNAFSYFKDASIVCLPSYREGMPKVLMEAAASACATVTTNVPGCREVIKSNISGILVKPRSPEELAKAIILLIDDQSLRMKFGEEGRKLANERFSTDTVVDINLSLYQKLFTAADSIKKEAN